MSAILRPTGWAPIYATLIFFAAFYLLPIYMLVLTAFKPFDRVGVTQMWTCRPRST